MRRRARKVDDKFSGGEKCKRSALAMCVQKLSSPEQKQIAKGIGNDGKHAKGLDDGPITAMYGLAEGSGLAAMASGGGGTSGV
jgi:hypothetical protein